MLKEKTRKKITKKNSKEIITIKRIRIKFEKKKRMNNFELKG